MKNSELIKNQKKSIVPDQKESEFAKTIDGQIMLMIKTAINNKSFIEAQTLSWSTIEQLLMPRLIGSIAKIHKINLPEDIYKSNIQHINLIYFTLSHDYELFKKLEEARKKRNEIIHKLTKLGDIDSIKKIAKESTKINILLQVEIIKRFTGEFPIPSLNLYRDGWNDCRLKILKQLDTLENKTNKS